MIQYTRHILDNGLTVICHTDTGTPFICVNTLYRVGSRNESEERTGFAHLFEHLMFSGSKNVNDFDYEIQVAGGENNAYTTFDYTNFYITIPAENIETALWLESDRMLQLNFSQSALDVQKNVVIEEFKQRYLNAPYGDTWLKLRPLAYQQHPYKWPVIGKTPEHIERATLDDVKDFFHRFYTPDRAIICISGNIAAPKALELVQKWFGDIPPSDGTRETIPMEPIQKEARELVVPDNNVPADVIYKVYHMGARMSDHFYTCDLISDILSNGQSSRLYQNLIKKSELFSSIDAYVTGDLDPGLFVFSGKISPGYSTQEAEQAILHEIECFINDPISEREFEKVINKTEARIKYNEINYQAKAANLAFFEFLGDVSLINNEEEQYRKISINELKNTAKALFVPENCSTLFYLKKK
ncbi:insulinase family protein [Odoribacter sp. OttesenSCG-928-J03]|nr:insulinase family protein [Odoribacter sp. OttesenSCG-928-J03]